MTMMNSKAGGLFRKALLQLLIAFSLAGCAALQSGSLEGGLNPSEKMMWSTYAFGTKHGLATCFIVLRRDSSAPDGTVAVVVTAAHILSTAPKGPFYFVARIAEGDGDPQIVLVELRPPQSSGPIFVKHPLYDIGAFEIQIPPHLAHLITFPSFLNEKAIGSERDRPRAGQDVLFVGFPRVLPGTAGGFPVLRAGKIASYSGSRSGKQQVFLINTDVYPGDSGGPVFAARSGGKPRLVGMVTARAGRDPNAIVPLAIALDATTIHETLELVAERARRIDGARSLPHAAGGSVAQFRPAASGVGSWLVQAVGNGSRDLTKKAPTIKANLPQP
jgi:Trypsin-like peptidase domain